MINKIVITEIKHPSRKLLCQSNEGCLNIATTKIWMRGEGKKCVCDKHTVHFFKMVSEINIEE